MGTKDKIVNYIIENLDKIIESHLLSMEENDINFIGNILKENGKATIKNKKIPLSLIFNKKDNILIHIYYDKKNDITDINIQEDIAEEMKKILKSKSFKEEYKSVMEFKTNLMSLLEVYGIVESNELYKIYNKIFEQIDKKTFEKNLIYNTAITMVKVNNYYYISILGLDDEKTEEYIDNQIEEYKIYSKEFYISVNNREYLKGLKSYKMLYDYLLKYYNLDLNKDDEVFELIVCDYIYQIQESKLRAKESILKNLDNFFEINSKEKNIIINYLNKIYYEYPKWRKKGNI